MVILLVRDPGSKVLVPYDVQNLPQRQRNRLGLDFLSMARLAEGMRLRPEVPSVLHQ